MSILCCKNTNVYINICLSYYVVSSGGTCILKSQPCSHSSFFFAVCSARKIFACHCIQHVAFFRWKRSWGCVYNFRREVRCRCVAGLSGCDSWLIDWLIYFCITEKMLDIATVEIVVVNYVWIPFTLLSIIHTIPAWTWYRCDYRCGAIITFFCQ